VQVFRPRLLLGALAVLCLGIIPPLLIWAIVQAAESAVERTRIRRLGLQDPLAAAEALHGMKARAQTPTAMMTALSLGGVGVGVMALIIVLSVMSGFEADLQKKILGTNAHGVVTTYGPDMEDYQRVLTTVRQVRGITGATPFIANEVMISSEGNIAGALIKGIDPATVGSVTDLPEYVLPGGELRWLEEPARIAAPRLGTFDGTYDGRPSSARRDGPPDDLAHDPLVRLADGPAPEAVLPGILLGRELAASLKVRVGDRLNVVSPLGGELGPQGPMPKSRPFKVAGILYSGMYEYDSKFVYILLSEAQSFFNLRGASGVEVKVAEVDNARSTMKAVYDLLDGYPFRTKDWGEMNRNLFAALRLEKLVMGIILSLIVIVAAGLIVATVIMLVLEKRKEIAVLKALGVPDGGIVKIFLLEGLQIGVAGGVLGLVSGLAWCLFIERVGIKLDPQVYYIPSLPVKIEPFQTALAVLIAVLITFLASIYPALKASQVEPVDGLKSE
jgi:lipoprotein-releasing system permease protein